MPIQYQKIIEILSNQSGHIYAILDGAREPKILELLGESGEDYLSLYQGKAGKELADVAPYLVDLSAKSPLLRTLITSGWDQSWGIFLISDEDFNSVRSHFRHFLMVLDEDGKELYFRFYDPRVLRVFLPTCTVEEAQTFFGQTVKAFFMEDEHTERLIQFTCTRIGILKRNVNLSSTPE